MQPQKILSNWQWLGAASGFVVGLLGLPAAGLAVPITQSNLIAQLNPNPSILSEPLYNRSNSSSQNPNLLSEPPANRPPSNVTPAAPLATPTPSAQTTPPLLENTQTPSATVTPVNGTIGIRMVNETGAEISYQVIGDTQYRTLTGDSEIMLRDLEIPTTVTFRRQDGGLLQVTLQPSATAGMLDLNLNEATDLAIDRTTLTINEEGSAFLN